MTISRNISYLLAGLLLTVYLHGHMTLIEDHNESRPSRSLNDSLKWFLDSMHLVQQTPGDYTPLSFLDLVDAGKWKDTMITSVSMSGGFPADWVKRSDIDTLMVLVNSKRKCYCTMNPLSSYLPKYDSAYVGGYAIVFVNSFRCKTTVAMGLNNCPKTDTQSVREIIEWYEGFRKTE